MDEKTRRISALLDPPSQPNQTNGVHKKYRHSKSAPMDFSLSGKHGGINMPKTIVSTFHPGVGHIALVLVFYLGVGTLCFFFFKDHIKGDKTNRTLDAIYFCVVTMTTVGYGDLLPNSVATKLLACAFVFGGVALVGILLSKAADYLVEKQEKSLLKAIRHHQRVGEIDILKENKTHIVRYKLLMTAALLLVLMIVGTIFLSRVEGFGLVDSFYCVCSTITTLGYGDKSFSTVAGRIFAVFWILASTIILAQFFLYLAELNTEHRQESLVKWVLKRRTTYTDLEAADLDDDGEVSAAEFIIYKLKEMGKISQEDIALIMVEFDAIDVDKTGILPVSDITLAQSSQTEN